MTPVLVDTSVLIDVLRGDHRATVWLSALEAVPICSEITRAEILQGMRASERQATERLLLTMRWSPVDQAISRTAGELGRRFRRSHRGLGIADLVIAATCVAHGADLATTNVRHFPMFDGLRAPYPT